MINYLKLFYCLILISSILSCKDADSDVQPEVHQKKSYPNYSQLEVGNYWIYERFILKPDGEEISLNKFDSSYVEKDTLINGKTYYKLHLPSLDVRGIPQNLYLRDSLHYIVDVYGNALFSSQNFGFSLGPIRYSYLDSEKTDTLFSYERIMSHKDSLVQLPGGAFKTLRSTLYFTYMGSQRPLGIRQRITLYAEKVGIVYATLPFFSSNPDYTIQKLVRYNVN